MLDRRTLFPALAGVATGAIALLKSSKAEAATAAPYRRGFKGDVEVRGSTDRNERLPTLDLESQQDFLTGFRIWNQTSFRTLAPDRMNQRLEERGIDPASNPSLTVILDIADKDPVLGLAAHTWLNCQFFTWKTIQDHFHADADRYLDELEAADKLGPGTLELNPNMKLPDHTKHEIHIMPGGYVGDPLGGYMFHYGTNNFYTNKNNKDELHKVYANAVPVPVDGVVKRVLDVGCTIGQMTVALKERFPEAEVWGIDAGAPMLRYGHMRAIDLGVDIQLAQRLAEDMKFEDNSFDIVTSYILHHEMPAEISRQHVREAFRVLRPGGVFFPIDFYTGGTKPSPLAHQKYRHFWDMRWNNEVWWDEYESLDLLGAMRAAGFEATENGPRAWIGSKNLLGIKPA
jgi:SAM-dependent methyltransferase